MLINGYGILDLYQNAYGAVYRITGFGLLCLPAFLLFVILAPDSTSQTRHFFFRLSFFASLLLMFLWVRFHVGFARHRLLNFQHEKEVCLVTHQYDVKLKWFLRRRFLGGDYPVARFTLHYNNKQFLLAQNDLYHVDEGDSVLVRFFPADPHIAEIVRVTKKRE